MEKVGKSGKTIAAEAALLFGEGFLRQIPKLLADKLGVRHVFVGEIDQTNPLRVNVLSFWAGDRFHDGYSYDLRHTPCETVFDKEACCYPNGVQKLFPLDADLKNFGIEGYAGVPLFTISGNPLGLLVALHDAPIENEAAVLETLNAFAPRVQAEIESLFAEKIVEETEKKFSSIFHNTSAGLAIADASGIILRNNTALEKYLGYGERGLLGRHFTDFTHPEDRSAESRLVADVLGGRIDHYRLEKRCLRADGEIVWFDVSVSANRGDGNEVDSFVGVVIDISERKQAEAEVQRAHARADDILQGTNAGHWEWDIPTGALTLNERWAETLGHQLKELEPINVETLRGNIHPDDVVAAEEALQRHFHGQTDYYDAVFRQPHKEGGWVWVNARGKISARDGDGKPLRMSGIYLDVTDMKNMEEDLRLALVDAEQANQAKSEFLASMSHELRTPLNAVLGFAQMLLYDPKSSLTPGQAENVDHIMEGGKHLLALINEVLDLARIEADKIILSLDEVDADHMIADCVALVTPLGLERDISIVQKVPAVDPPRLRTDRVRLKQVLLNLLSNAVAYNVDGGKVEVRVEPVGTGYLRISVSDTGIGIAENERPTVFNMFHRLNADPMISREGAGIGLTVSKLLVERMAGRIDFESERGKGSTFWVEIPTISNMETLIWNDALLIDVEEIDADHRRLSALVNRFAQMPAEDSGIDNLLAELLDYAIYHFRREETIMTVCEYPDLTKHRAMHEGLKKQLNELAAAWRADPSQEVLSDLRKMLSRWLFNHIIHDDVGIAPYVRGREKAIAAALKELE